MSSRYYRYDKDSTDRAGTIQFFWIEAAAAVNHRGKHNRQGHKSNVRYTLYIEYLI